MLFFDLDLDLSTFTAAQDADNWDVDVTGRLRPGE